jgi:hypothetical protein
MKRNEKQINEIKWNDWGWEEMESDTSKNEYKLNDIGK